MELNFEWHVPWPADWTKEKKLAAGERLAEYWNNGTVVETRHRGKAHAEVAHILGCEDDGPYLKIRLEF